MQQFVITALTFATKQAPKLAKTAGEIGVKLLTTYATERLKHAAKPAPTNSASQNPTHAGKTITKIAGGLVLSSITVYAAERMKHVAKPSPSSEYAREYARIKARQDALRDSREGESGYPPSAPSC